MAQKIKRRIWVPLLLLAAIQVCAQKPVRLSSPDGNIRYEFRLRKGIPFYGVAYKGTPIVANAGLGLSFNDGTNFNDSLLLSQPVFRNGEDAYTLVVGKTKNVHDTYQEVTIPLHTMHQPERKLNLVVRIFNDGLAFRYDIPAQTGWSSFALTAENTSFNLAGNPDVLTLFLPNFQTSHEGPYHSLPWDEVKEDTLMEMPTLFNFSGKIFLAITEAELVDYAGMYLIKHRGNLVGTLSPLPDQPAIKIKATLPHQSPWRVFLISDRAGALIESNIITDLNQPCQLKDVSWIQPGKTTWPWWNGDITPDTTFAPGNNFETNKYYIDFCARNGIAYHSVVEYGGHEWYVNDSGNFSPGPGADVTQPVPGLDMQQICDYARSKHVGIRVWVHWAALYPQLEKAFTQYEKWGISGLMVDFMDRDDQEMVNIQLAILKAAAKHKLHIQFHGAYKPTGLYRTYPNEFTREGVMNYEYDKWSKDATPDHDICVPFTRMLAGPTDYHLGGFRAVPDSLFKIQYTRPLVMGTRCHMLAMYVVLESYLQMVCDFPAAYEGQPGFDFLKIVPTTWDDTKVPAAALNQYIVVARRKGDEWFVGAITNNQPRTIPIPMQFLGPGTYTADIYTDAADANPNHVNRQSRTVHNTDRMTVALHAGGGTVMHIRKL